jgi:hypothetical protein
MLTSAVAFYDVVLFVHILAVVLAFGPTFAYPVFLAVAERSDPRALPAVGRAIHAWDRIGAIMLVVIIAAGLYLTIDRWSFSDFFISWGMLAVIVLGGLSGGYFMPRTKRLVALGERDIAASGEGEVKFSAEFQALNKQVGKVGTVAGLIVILTIYVMTAQPFQ